MKNNPYRKRDSNDFANIADDPGELPDDTFNQEQPHRVPV
jgi:hypothetical protein